MCVILMIVGLVAGLPCHSGYYFDGSIIGNYKKEKVA